MAPAREQGPAELDGLRVLLVEDEPGAREGIHALLRAHNADVQSVESAAAAREAYLLQRPDIMITDIGLPGVEGYVLMQQIRSMERERGDPRVPAMALTAFARIEDVERALAAATDPCHACVQVGRSPVAVRRVLTQARALLYARCLV
jgi:CheY-like chemotaxis protein